MLHHAASPAMAAAASVILILAALVGTRQLMLDLAPQECAPVCSRIF